MSWLKKALSITSTVGKVAGSLMGALGENQESISFVLAKSNAGDDIIVFEKIRDEYRMYNKSLNKHEFVTIATPAIIASNGKGLEPSTKTVKYGDFVDLTYIFKNNAEFDNSKFEMLVSSDTEHPTTPHVSIPALAFNVPANGEKYEIATGIKISLKDDKATLTSDPGQPMSGIHLLELKCSSDIGTEVTDIDADGTECTVILPQKLKSHDYYSVRAHIEMSSATDVIAAQGNARR